MISLRQRNTRLVLAAFCFMFFTDQDGAPSHWFWSTAPGRPDAALSSLDGMPPSGNAIEAFPVSSVEYEARCGIALRLPRSMMAAVSFRDVFLCNAAALQGQQLAHAVSSFKRQVDAAYEAYEGDIAQELTIAFVAGVLATMCLLLTSCVPARLRPAS